MESVPERNVLGRIIIDGDEYTLLLDSRRGGDVVWHKGEAVIYVGPLAMATTIADVLAYIRDPTAFDSADAPEGVPAMERLPLAECPDDAVMLEVLG